MRRARARLRRLRELADRQGVAGLLGIGAVVLFALVGIGGPLVGVGVFSSSGDLETQPPWRDHRATLADNTVAPFSDTWDAIAPALREAGERVRSGDVPLLSPYEAGGHPSGFSTPTEGAWDPMNLPWYLMPERFAHGYAKVLEIVVASGFMYLFCRRLRLAPGVSWLAASVYVGSGFLVSWTNWPQAHVAALVPALFWAAERLLQERRWRDVVPLVLVAVWQLAAGFPLLSIYTAMALGPYVVMRLLNERRERRKDLRPAARSVLHFAAAGTLALLLAAPLLAGLSSLLGGTDLSYRDEFRGATLYDVRGLTTAVFAYPLGVPTWGTWALEDFVVESHLFLGAGVVLLAFVGLVKRPPDALPRGVRPFMLAVPILVVALIYADSPLLRTVQALPGIGTSFIARTRVLFCFCGAVAAAIGAASWWEGRRRRRREELIVWAVLGAGALVALVGTVVAITPVPLWHRRSLALTALTALAGVASVAVFLWARRRGRPDRRAAWALGLVSVVAVGESLVLVLPLWGRTPVEEHYRVTPEIALLQERQGDGRVELVGGHWPGVTAWHGLRTTTGHTFFSDEWRHLVEAADPGAFVAHTLARLGPAADLSSPVLDRLGVRYVLVGTDGLIPGDVTAVVVEGPPLLPEGEWITATMERRQLRAVGLVLAEPLTVTGRSPRYEVEVSEADRGDLLFEGGRSLPGELWLWVDLAVDLAASDAADIVVRVRLVGTGRPAALGTQPLLRLVADPGDDGLRVVAALPGGLVLERTNALPRYRWAADVVVAPDPHERLALLATERPGGQVLVETPLNLPGAPGAGSVTEVDERDADRRRIRVSATGAGLLVVADAHLPGWRATVDGRAVDLVRVDHALMGVVLPAGDHEVVLVYRPEWGLAWWASAAASAVLVALVLVRRPPRPGREHPGTCTTPTSHT